MELYAKLVDCILQSTSYQVSHRVMNMPLIRLNKFLVCCHSTKNQHCNLCKFLPLLDSSLSSHYLAMRHYYSQVEYTSAFNFKLIHPCIWIHMILISHYLHFQTHHNNYRQTFRNFFSESEEIQSKWQRLW